MGKLVVYTHKYYGEEITYRINSLTYLGDHVPDLGETLPDVGDFFPDLGDALPEVGDSLPEGIFNSVNRKNKLLSIFTSIVLAKLPF
jgi:hypothetical protein